MRYPVAATTSLYYKHGVRQQQIVYLDISKTTGRGTVHGKPFIAPELVRACLQLPRRAHLTMAVGGLQRADVSGISIQYFMAREQLDNLEFRLHRAKLVCAIKMLMRHANIVGDH